MKSIGSEIVPMLALAIQLIYQQNQSCLLFSKNHKLQI